MLIRNEKVTATIFQIDRQNYPSLFFREQFRLVAQLLDLLTLF